VVALPEIGRDLGYSAQTLQAVISAYAIAASGFLLFGGRASPGWRRKAESALPARRVLRGGPGARPDRRDTGRHSQQRGPFSRML
jgi:hypothetical protein